MGRRLIIVGGARGTAVAASLARAAASDDWQVRHLDAAEAYGDGLVQKILWRAAGQRPQHLKVFSDATIEAARRLRPDVMIVTGIAPLSAEALSQLRHLGVRVGCFLTDDPANPAHRAPWFLRALSSYDCVFTPRPWTIEELRVAGARRVEALSFGYDPVLCHPDGPIEPQGTDDVLFVGTGDADRVVPLAALSQLGFAVGLYGRYYDRWSATRGLSRGEVDAEVVRRQTVAARVGLCLVRRANRDGHVMRSFEMAACGACMLVERTTDHCAIFGDDGDCVRYFDSWEQMVLVLRELLADREQRMSLRSHVLQRVQLGQHTYADRLRTMLTVLGA